MRFLVSNTGRLRLGQLVWSRFWPSKCRGVHSQWTSTKVRQSFIDFFCHENGHQFIPSSSVLPPKDLGSYFTNAGMNQFKPIFLGTVTEGSDLAGYRRVANSQKCVRVGGKHNDLDDVGLDLTHHTFFEMLGSWSFGDYFKDKACGMALDLLLNVYHLPLDRLYFTYFGGCPNLGLEPDLETKDIWNKLGVPSGQILPFGMTDNFWDMGDIGPCGPCTEIHYDHLGNRDASHLVNTGSQEVVEIWNLVFMQYDRHAEDTLVPLPRTHVDTGMGLERMCAVLQGTRSNYNTDLFLPLFDLISKNAGVPAYKDNTGQSDNGGLDTAYRIVADHTRMATVCISDGLLPGRLDEEHKLRTVIYRALYQCHQVLNAPQGLMGKLVKPVIETLGDAYPELSANEGKVQKVLDMTEDRYLSLYQDGKTCIQKLLRKNTGLSVLTGEHIRQLSEGQFGTQMSLEMVDLIARGYGLTVHQADMEALAQQHHGTMVSMANGQGPELSESVTYNLKSRNVPVTDDSAKYDYTSSIGKYTFPVVKGTILHVIDEGNQPIDSVGIGSLVGIIVDQTPFYAEKGGQIGDIGTIKSETGTISVSDTQSSQGYVIHVGTVIEGSVDTGQHVSMEINTAHREGCMRNHTATHLVNAALKAVLGPEVKQRGSLVQPEKLTFDFSCVGAVEDKATAAVERIVTDLIKQSLPVGRQLLPIKEAEKMDGVVYLHDVVYPSEVYVVSLAGVDRGTCVSAEFCGGTHVHNTADLGHFCIPSVTGVTSGTKTITCLTGEPASRANQLAEEIKEAFSDLEQHMKKASPNLEKVTELQKYINRVIGTEVLPKLTKDEMIRKMETIGTDINVALNKQAFLNLQQDLKKKMAEEGGFIVQPFKMKTLLKLNKVMQKLSVTKPLILVVETSNNTVAYVALPQELKDQRKEIVEQFIKTTSATITKEEAKYVLVTSRGRHVENFLSVAMETLTVFQQSGQLDVKCAGNRPS